MNIAVIVNGYIIVYFQPSGQRTSSKHVPVDRVSSLGGQGGGGSSAGSRAKSKSPIEKDLPPRQTVGRIPMTNTYTTARTTTMRTTNGPGRPATDPRNRKKIR